MDTFRWIKHTKSSWGYIFAALFALLAAIIPIFGVVSFVLTVVALYLQASEAVNAKKALDLKHASFNRDIEQAADDATAKHKEAMQEIQGAKKEAVAQHAEALLQIDQARQEAAREYEEAAKGIRKVGAEQFLLQAHELATSLIQKDELINKAVAIYPDFRQQELRQLGIDMSGAVIGNVDPLKEKSLRAVRRRLETILNPLRLEPDERTFFIEHAIKYLEETELQSTNADVGGLVYLACIYGCSQRYDDMMLVLEKVRQNTPIMQVLKGQALKRQMLFMLVDACCSEPMKIDRLRQTLALPQPTEQYFRHYMTQEYPKNPKYKTNFSEWIAVPKPEAPGEREKDSAVLKICPP
ncbi:MAG TPA: hypothetical protein VFU32_11165, partial [Ktedonobacterales bacterium]|nr:hypothetical protein [Ktedonobacterales bacterium]